MNKALRKKKSQKEIEPVNYQIAIILAIPFIALLLLGIIGLKHENASIKDVVTEDTEASSAVLTKLTSGIIADIEPNFIEVVSMASNENNAEEQSGQHRNILTGYCTTNVNLRKEPDIDSEIITVFSFNTSVLYVEPNSNEEWVSVSYNGDWYYLKSEYLSNTECKYITYTVPDNNFMAYMSYKAISSKTSFQYKLRTVAYTGNYGIRMINGRYCCALGTGFNISVGDYADLILSNGTVIPIIISDIKDDKHTDNSNIVTTADGSIAEFLVDVPALPYKVHNNDNTGSGDISNVCDLWSSSITEVKIYEKNYFD